MASIQEEASGKKGGEIRYLTPLNIEHSTTKKYCRFKIWVNSSMKPLRRIIYLINILMFECNFYEF